MKVASLFFLWNYKRSRELSVIEALERNGFDIIEKKQDGEWITIISKQALNDD